jgi:hypothetical protein
MPFCTICHFSSGDRSTRGFLLVRCAVSYLLQGLTVLEGGALSDLDNITVRIADVAANLAVLGDRFREKLGSPTLPQFIARLNIRNSEIHKTVDMIRVGNAERYRRAGSVTASTLSRCPMWTCS